MYAFSSIVTGYEIVINNSKFTCFWIRNKKKLVIMKNDMLFYYINCLSKTIAELFVLLKKM